MQFMSPQHVSVMNRLLRESTAVRRAAKSLDRDYVLGYRLTAAPNGGDEHWTMTLGPKGVRFALSPADNPDLEVLVDYADMVRLTIAARAGEQSDARLDTRGDLSVMERVAPVYAIAQSVATVDVEFPDV